MVHILDHMSFNDTHIHQTVFHGDSEVINFSKTFEKEEICK